jgi:hypothetical protein
MKDLLMAGMLVGFAWASIGVVGYPRVSWKPGTVLGVGCALWLISRERLSSEFVEMWATIVFLVVLFSRQWLFPARVTKPKSPSAD